MAPNRAWVHCGSKRDEIFRTRVPKSGKPRYWPSRSSRHTCSMMSSGIFPGGSSHGTASVGKCLFHANPKKKLAPSETLWRANFIPASRPVWRRL